MLDLASILTTVLMSHQGLVTALPLEASFPLTDKKLKAVGFVFSIFTPWTLVTSFIVRLGQINYHSRATTGRSRLVAAPLRFQAKNLFLFSFYKAI